MSGGVEGACRWLSVELPTVAENLALDEALLGEAHEGLLGGTVVRTWAAAAPTVVLGSSSRVAGEVDLAACAAEGVAVVRRPSGGLTVVLGPGCLVWSVVTAWPSGPPEIAVVHRTMLDPLAAALSTPDRSVRRMGTSDLVVEVAGTPRKVSGNAVRVRSRAVLYHGTLLDDFDIGLVSRVLGHPPREPAYRAGRRHADFLANLGLGRTAIEAAVRRAFAASWPLEEWPADRVAALLRSRYLDAAWTHRLP